MVLQEINITLIICIIIQIIWITSFIAEKQKKELDKEEENANNNNSG